MLRRVITTGSYAPLAVVRCSPVVAGNVTGAVMVTPSHIQPHVAHHRCLAAAAKKSSTATASESKAKTKKAATTVATETTSSSLSADDVTPKKKAATPKAKSGATPASVATVTTPVVDRSKLIRKAFVMSVYPGHEEEYAKRHQPIWPELEQVLKDHGAHYYSIFLDPASRQLFAYVEIESEERWAAVASTEVCQKWWRHMSPLMPSASPWSPAPQAVDLKEVFHLR